MSGCKYFANQGICRKVPADVMDDQCVLHETRCLTIAEYEKKTGQKAPVKIPVQVRAKVEPPPARELKEIRSELKNLEFISGPVSWYYLEIPKDYLTFGANNTPTTVGNKRYHLFGDAHFSRENNCTEQYGVQCAAVDKNGTVINYNERCYDITYLLKQLFDETVAKKSQMDFFLEIPFRLPGYKPFEQREQAGYIYAIAEAFDNCLQIEKKGCPYNPYVRFHYSDVRLTDQHDLVSLNSTIMFSSMTAMVEGAVNLFMIFANAANLNALLSDSHMKEIMKQFVEHSDLTDAIITRFILRGQTLGGRTIDYNRELFTAMVKSDNFKADLKLIFDGMFAELPERLKKLPLYDTLLQLQERLGNYTTTRDGKNMFRIRAQLYELDKENVLYRGQKISSLIEKFLFDKYASLDLSAIYSSWRQLRDKIIMPLSKIRSATDFNLLSNIFIPTLQDVTNANVTTRLIYSDALLMDGYILARSFRSYSQPAHGREAGRAGELASIYAGAQHILNYVEFLKNYLGLQVIDSIDHYATSRELIDNRCLKKKDIGREF